MTRLEEIEVLSKLFGIFGGLVAAAVAIWTARQSLRQRQEDLRWKKAEMAKKVVDEWFEFEPSRMAFQMTEPRKRRYRTAEHLTEVIPRPYVLTALASESAANRPQEVFIQDCFDALFYFLDRTEQFLHSGLVQFEDVERPASYYVAHMSEHKKVYRSYAEKIGYSGAIAFLDRFGSWRQVPVPGTPVDQMKAVLYPETEVD